MPEQKFGEKAPIEREKGELKLTMEEADIIIRALKTYALDRNQLSKKSQFSNEREDYSNQTGETISLAKKVAELYSLPLHNGAEAFSELDHA
ncbi:MAG: hypothetical protein Q7K35_00815 [bacterium]|nr:hypothetical protein [bacterium]